MRQCETPKSEVFLQRGYWEINAAQEFSGRENILVIAGDKFYHRNLARLSTARPKGANTFQGCGERNHRTRRERHADIPAHGRFIPDFEGGKERVTTFIKKRGRDPVGWCFLHEPIKLDNPASS